VLQNILDDEHNSANRKEQLEKLKDYRSGNAVDKCRQLARLMDRGPDTGTEPWRNAKLVILFRNEFMHFRPSWDDEAIHNDDWIRELRRKVPVVEAYKRDFLFPHGFMTYGCTRWAIRSVLEFSSNFANILGVTDQFGAVDFHLP
jgi:hypothetical protein